MNWRLTKNYDITKKNSWVRQFIDEDGMKVISNELTRINKQYAEK